MNRDTFTEFTTESYWSERYRLDDIPWDAGAVTTPLKEYIDQLENPDLRILIPGAGSAYEAAYLYDNGFRNVTVIDLSDLALQRLMDGKPEFPPDKLIKGDFFRHEGTYDLVIEQTFFCALPPQKRGDYVTKMASLIRPGGKIAGVLFNDPLNDDHPPFGGNEQVYRDLFAEEFLIKVMQPCYNSIAPRAGRELFILLERLTHHTGG